MPLQLLAILAVAAITIGYAVRTGVTDPRWYSTASFAFAVPVLLAVFITSRRNVKAQAKELNEAATERFSQALAYLAVTTTDMLAVLFAGGASPKVGLIILGIAAAWILVWSPRALRKVVIQTKVTIQRDASAVFAFISDFENEPKYMPGMEVDKLTSGPIRSGTQFRFRFHMAGGTTFDGVEEIVDYEPPTRLTSRISTALRPNVDVVTFQPVTQGTLLKYRFETDVSYPSAIIGMGPLRWLTSIELWNRRRVAWARVKKILESSQPSASL